MISILVPVLNRPQNAQPLVDSIRAHTLGDHEIVFICTEGDKAEIAACVATGAKIAICYQPAGPGDYAKKINTTAYGLDRPFVFLGADDLEFTQGWDVAALDVAVKHSADVIGVDDGANPMVRRGKHATHMLVRRSYIAERGCTFDEIPNVIYHEGYDHQCVDNEIVRVAMDRRVWAFARRSLVIHHHPFFDKTVKRDDTYNKALANGAADIHLYRERHQAWSRKQRVTVL